MANFADKLALLITADSSKAVSELRKVGTTATSDLGTAEKAGTSFGKSLGGLGASAFAAVGGVTAVVGGLTALVSAGRESERANRLTEAVIKSTGGQAHVTAGQVQELARSLSEKTGVDNSAIRSSENLLLTFPKVRNEVGKGNDVFNQATATILDMSAALGQDAHTSTIQLGKALQDPIRGLTALRRVGVAFTDQQKEQIKTLVQSGHTLEAQKIILGELKTEFGGAAAAAADPLDKLKASAHNLEEEIGSALLPSFNEFVTDAQDLASVTELLNSKVGNSGGLFKSLTDAVERTIPGLGLLKSAQDLRAQSSKNMSDGDKAAADALKAVSDAQRQYQADLASGNASQEKLATDAKTLSDAQEHQASIQNAVTSAVQAGTAAADDAGTSAKAQAEAEKGLVAELVRLNDVALEAVSSDIALQKATIDVGAAIDAAAEKTLKAVAAKGKDVGASRDAQKAELDLQDAILSAVSAAEKDAKSHVDLTSSAQGTTLAIAEENAKHAAARRELDLLAVKYPQLAALVERYRVQLGLIPATVSTTVSLNSTGSSSGGGRRAFAEGGFVPGARGQAVPATVHGGEFVVSNRMLDNLARGGGSGVVFNVAINNPTGNGREIADQLYGALFNGQYKQQLRQVLGIT